MSRTRVVATLAAVAVALVIAAVAASASDRLASNRNGSGNELAGTWIVTAERPAPLTPSTVHQSYSTGGTFVSFGSDVPPAGRSPELGAWERVEGRLYASSGSFFRFDLRTGALVGSVRINRTLRLSTDGRSFTAIGRVMLLDLGGNVVASFLTPSRGVRMRVERIDEVPWPGATASHQ